MDASATDIQERWTTFLLTGPRFSDILGLYGDAPEIRGMITEYLRLAIRSATPEEHWQISRIDILNALAYIEDAEILAYFNRMLPRITIDRSVCLQLCQMLTMTTSEDVVLQAVSRLDEQIGVADGFLIEDIPLTCAVRSVSDMDKLATLVPFFEERLALAFETIEVIEHLVMTGRLESAREWGAECLRGLHELLLSHRAEFRAQYGTPDATIQARLELALLNALGTAPPGSLVESAIRTYLFGEPTDSHPLAELPAEFLPPTLFYFAILQTGTEDAVGLYYESLADGYLLRREKMMSMAILARNQTLALLALQMLLESSVLEANEYRAALYYIAKHAHFDVVRAHATHYLAGCSMFSDAQLLFLAEHAKEVERIEEIRSLLNQRPSIAARNLLIELGRDLPADDLCSIEQIMDVEADWKKRSAEGFVPLKFVWPDQ